VTITFFDSGKSVLLPRLSLEQQHALSALMADAGVRYGWQGKLCPQASSLAERAGAMWRRFNAWMMGGALLLLLIPIPPAPALAQRLKPRAVRPIEIAIITEAEAPEEPDARFHSLFLAELNKRRDIAIRPRGAWRIYLSSMVITTKGKAVGYSAALIAISKDCEHYWLSVKAAPTLEEIAKAFVESLNKEVFTGRVK
jgi:hypothetical protein